MKRLKVILALLILVWGVDANVVSAPFPLHKFSVVQNIEWARPDGVSLTMDIYTPDSGKKSFPVYVIFHGGGWLINNETIMDQMSEYMVAHSEYVICNVNYRLLTAGNNSTTINEIVEDAFGAVLWIKENIARYKGDPNRIAVSGDSAGGHLAAMFLTASERLESDGFEGPTLGFKPTYLTPGRTPEQIARSNGLQVQAVVLNYPAIDLYKACLGRSGDGSDGFESTGNFFWQIAQAEPRGIFGHKINVREDAEHYKMVSPLYNIPRKKDKVLPPVFCAVGSNDNLTTPALVKVFANALENAGQKVQYWEHEGRPHAYLDSGSNEFLGTSFEKDAPPAIDQIIAFLNGVFNQ